MKKSRIITNSKAILKSPLLFYFFLLIIQSLLTSCGILSIIFCSAFPGFTVSTSSKVSSFHNLSIVNSTGSICPGTRSSNVSPTDNLFLISIKTLPSSKVLTTFHQIHILHYIVFLDNLGSLY